MRGTYALCSNEEFEAYMNSDGWRLLRSVWSRFGRSFKKDEKDDFFQEGSIVIAHALALYDPAKGEKNSYIYASLENRLCMMDRARKARIRGLDMVVTDASLIDWIAMADPELGPLQTLLREEHRNKLWTAVYTCCLTDMEEMVVELSMEGYNQLEIAGMLGVQQGSISKLLKQATQRIRLRLIQTGQIVPDSSLDETALQTTLRTVPENRQVPLEDPEDTLARNLTGFCTRSLLEDVRSLDPRVYTVRQKPVRSQSVECDSDLEEDNLLFLDSADTGTGSSTWEMDDLDDEDIFEDEEDMDEGLFPDRPYASSAGMGKILSMN